MRIGRDEMYLAIANVMSLRSVCLRLQVGAVIVKGNRIVSSGYCGVSSGEPHCLPENTPLRYDNDTLVIRPNGTTVVNPLSCSGPGCEKSHHAEANAVVHAARNGISTEGATMYCTHSPCMNCAKLIVNSGISEYVYSIPYRDTKPLEYMALNGVKIRKVVS